MRVGVLGAGQLGRMLALAGYPLGLRFELLDPAEGSPASEVAPQIVAAWDDAGALERLARCDVVTFEFENVPVATLETLARSTRVNPSAEALRVAQDRLEEKTAFSALGIPTARFERCDDQASLESAAARIGLPAVLKTRRFGYDGKGQIVLRRAEDLAGAFSALGGVPLIIEAFVPFARELSIIAVRAASGETRFYPLVENEHAEGILRLTRAPAPDVSEELQTRAEGYVKCLLERLGYVGVLALELFDVSGELYANEFAPRVHNSGHWTIEGAETSQFENHLRAICDLPLGSTRPRGLSAMVNLIGSMPERRAMLALPDTHLHNYGKAPRERRKVGHVTVSAADRDELEQRIARVQALMAAD